VTTVLPPEGTTTGLPPRLAEGVELIGETAGSGYKKPPSLARRGDGQMIQLTRLLYLVAEAADGSRDEQAIADVVSEKFGKTVSADNVRTLIEDKLRPLGVLALADGSSPPVEKPDPLLALRWRRAVIPATVSKQVASLFKPLFLPPVVLAALAGLVMFDSWLFLHHGVAQAFRQAMEHPAIMVPLLGMIILSAGWHEFGHAAGCTYGGACPGAMGAGIYLAYPAFYTDVTDSYRLNRAGRLRTDLAGVYFNGLFILATAGLYAATHWEALLLVIVVQHIEAAHQLLPFLRLDGYYIVADLTGVPDLFSRIKPILASSLPWTRTDPKVKELKLWARLVVTFWVVLVVPLLLFQLLMLLLHAPRILATAGHSLVKQAGAVGTAFGHADVVAVLVGALQILILLLPLVGIILTLGRLGNKAGRGIWRGTEGKPVTRALAVLASAALIGGLAYTWLPNGDYERIRPGERGTLREGVAAVAKAPTGRPSLLSEQKAADAGRLVVPRGEKVPVSTSSTTTTAPPRSATSTTVASNRRSSTTLSPTTTEPGSTTTTTNRRSTTTTAA